MTCATRAPHRARGLRRVRVGQHPAGDLPDGHAGMLAEIPRIAEVHLEANNRTWDTIAERGDDARRLHRRAAAVRLPRPEAADADHGAGSRRTCSTRRAAFPAAGVAVELHVVERRRTHAGRPRPSPMPTAAPTRRCCRGDRLEPGVYELTFHAADYFRRPASRCTDPPFLGDVVVRVGIADRARPLPRAAAALAVRLQHLPGLVSAHGRRRARSSSCCRSLADMHRGARLHHADVPVAADARRCTRTCAAWMAAAGMTRRVDAAGNLRGVYAGRRRPRRGCSSARTSTRCRTPARSTACSAWCWASRSSSCWAAGDCRSPSRSSASRRKKACASACRSSAAARSSARWTTSLLGARDADGVHGARGDPRLRPRSDAHRPGAVAPATSLGYLEFHIEQGPVLDALGLPLGVVDAIAGQTPARRDVSPARPTMPARRRWTRAATRWPARPSGSLAVERRRRGRTPGLVATVGRIDVRARRRQRDRRALPASLDVRHADDDARARRPSIASLRRGATRSRRARGL